MTAEQPTPGELSRRIDDVRDEVRAGITGINERLDRMPTNELLTAYLASTNGQVEGLRGQLTELKTHVAGVETSLRAEIDAQEKKTIDAKRWAIGALLSAGGLVLGVLTFAERLLS